MLIKKGGVEHFDMKKELILVLFFCIIFNLTGCTVQPVKY